MWITSDNNYYKTKLHYFFHYFQKSNSRFELMRHITNEKTTDFFFVLNAKYKFRISIDFMYFLP